MHEHVYIIAPPTLSQMTEELDAIVFDVGGTLIDMSPTRADLLAKVLVAHGQVADPKILAKAVARTDRILDERSAALERGNDEALRRDFVRLVLEQTGHRGDAGGMEKALEWELDHAVPEVGNWVMYPEARGVIRELRSRGFKLGIISNATELVRRVLDRLDLTREFDFVIISEEVGANKPSPKIFRIAAERAGTSPNRMLYIGDKLSTDVAGAVGAGMNAILVDRFDTFADADCIRIRDLGFLRHFI